jgi:TM2 domain-containing membrane protein YozV
MPSKSTFVAFILWLPGLVGLCGLHRLYLGFVGTGIVWFCTIGLLGIGQLIDLFRLGSLVRTANFARYGAAAIANVNTNTVAPVINVNVAAPNPPCRSRHSCHLSATPRLLLARGFFRALDPSRKDPDQMTTPPNSIADAVALEKARADDQFEVRAFGFADFLPGARRDCFPTL